MKQLAKAFLIIFGLTTLWTALIVFLYTKNPLWAIGFVAWSQGLDYHFRKYKEVFPPCQ